MAPISTSDRSTRTVEPRPGIQQTCPRSREAGIGWMAPEALYAEPFPYAFGNDLGPLRAQPGVKRKDAAQKRSVLAHAVQQMLPVEPSSLGIDQVEHIAPIAALPLDHIQFAPDQLFHR